MKRVLMIAYHYPPLTGSSGVQRTFRFAQYLRESGWEPIILTAATHAYESISSDATQLEGIPVCRAFALDTARHLAVFGRYPGLLARPDRWVSWWPAATLAGMRLIRKYRPDVVWSTYPIATAHLIGHSLAKLSGLPWVADFRDPMAHSGYPEDQKTWQSFHRIEKKVFAAAHAATFTTQGALDFYKGRYPDSPTRLHRIENGYDEEAFALAMQRIAAGSQAEDSDRLVLLHSGVIYPQWRNPRMLFRALRRLTDDNPSSVQGLVMRFRAPVNVNFLKQQAEEEGVMEFMDIAPELDYIGALAEMIQADGLLLLQNAECNDQVPAKLYEYLRAGRPILGLTAMDGDTAKAVREHPGNYLADIESDASIMVALRDWLQATKSGMPPRQVDASVARCSRRGRTQQLAAVLNSVIR